MARTYDSLLDSPAPPHIDEGKYYVLLDTSAQFMYDAADMYDYDPMNATTKYLVVRDRTQEGILDPINAWLGTSYSIPPSTYPTPGG